MISRAKIIFKSASPLKAPVQSSPSQPPAAQCHQTKLPKCSKSHNGSITDRSPSSSTNSISLSHCLVSPSICSSSASSSSSSASALSSSSCSSVTAVAGQSSSSTGNSGPFHGASSSCGAISSPGSTPLHSDNEPYDGGSGSGADFHDENVWPDLDALLRDQISEIVHKWRQIDDEIWSKIVCFERNRRIAKAYARSQVISITGSEQGFDGFRIGLNGFPNIKRDPETDRIKRQIQAGFKLKIDAAGNVFVKRVGPCPVYVGGANCVGIRSEPEMSSSPLSLSAFSSSYPSSSSSSASSSSGAFSPPASNLISAHSGSIYVSGSSYTGLLFPEGKIPTSGAHPGSGYHVPASRFAPLEPNRAQQIFDMKHYQRAVSEFCQAKRPQAMLEQLHRGCLHAIQFGVVDDRTPKRVLHHPCWIVLINIVALDLLWSRIGTADVPIGPHMHQRLMLLNENEPEDDTENERNAYSKDHHHHNHHKAMSGTNSGTSIAYGNVPGKTSSTGNAHFKNKHNFDKTYNLNKQHGRGKSVTGFGDVVTPSRRNDAKRKGVDDLYYSGYFAKISYQDNKQQPKTNNNSNKSASKSTVQTSALQQQQGSVSETLSGTAAPNNKNGIVRRPVWSGRTGNSNKVQQKSLHTKQRQMCKRDFLSDDEHGDDSIEDDDDQPAAFEQARGRPSKHQQMSSRNRRNSSSALFHTENSTEPGHTHFGMESSVNRLQRYASCSALHHLDSNSSSYDEVTESRRSAHQKSSNFCQKQNKYSGHRRGEISDSSQLSYRNAPPYGTHLHPRSLSTSLEHLSAFSTSQHHFSRDPYSKHNAHGDNPLYQDKLLYQRPNNHVNNHQSKHARHQHHHHHRHNAPVQTSQTKASSSGSYNLYPLEQRRKINSNGNSSATTSDSIDSSFVSSQSSLLSSSSASLSSLDDIPRRFSVSKNNRSSSCKNLNSLKDSEHNNKPKYKSTTNKTDIDSPRTPSTSGCCRHRLYKTRAQSKALAESKFKSNLLSARKQYSSNIELHTSNNDTYEPYNGGNNNPKPLPQYQFPEHHSHHHDNNTKDAHQPNKDNGNEASEKRPTDDGGEQKDQEHSEQAKQSQKLAFNQRLGRLLLLQQHIQFQHNIQHQAKQQCQRDDELHL